MFKSFFFGLMILCVCNVPLFSQNQNEIVEEQKLFKPIANAMLFTENDSFKLSQIYEKKPIVLALIFTRCSGVCSPLIGNLSDNLKQLSTERNFKIVVLSFDPRDDMEQMKNYGNRFVIVDKEKWLFAITPDIDTLLASIGFDPIWDSTRQQYEHEALLVGINENGHVARKLLGLRSAQDLDLLLREINNEFIPSYPLPNKNMIFSCFTYDPITGKKKPSWGLLVLLIPAVLTGLLITILSTRKRNLIS